MGHNIDTMFHDIPIHDTAKLLLDKLLSTKEERSFIAQQLLDFYLKEHNLDVDLHNRLKKDYLNAIHLLLVAFSFIIVIKDEEVFQQFCRRFIFESKQDSQEVFYLKKFFLSNFDSSEEYYIQALSSHSDIKKRTDILLEKYIQFFHYYL